MPQPDRQDRAPGATGPTLVPAELAWRDGGTPVSTRFGDVYFAAEDGLAEARHVFLAGTGLPEAWTGRPVFTIAETGFGTGLNFLAAWQLWRRTPAGRPRLHFVSVEGFPLAPADLARAHAAWPELAPLAAALRAAWPPLVPGFHRRLFEDGQVILTLLFGPVAEVLADLEATVDAWFLDGFAPSRNPEMWSEAVFAEMARLSRPGARVATFTAAGAVRRALEAAGFATEKTAGFGRKREMLRAMFRGPPAPSRLAPWFRPPPARRSPGTALVIGAGIAGAAGAEALRRRGWQVTVTERNGQVAAEASGNAAGIVMPHLIAGATPHRAFNTQAYLYVLHRLAELARAAPDGLFRACGGLQLAVHEREARRQAAVLAAGTLPDSHLRPVDAGTAAALAGCPMPVGGLWLPRAGWLHPPALCQALLGEAPLLLSQPVARLEPTAGGWCARSMDGRAVAEAEVVVLAGSLDVRVFAQAATLPLVPCRGQVTRMPATPRSRRLSCVVVHDGYLTPAWQGWHVVGATFDRTPDRIPACPPAADPADNRRNLERLAAWLPALAPEAPPEALPGRASLRAGTVDHLPLVGPLPDVEAYRAAYPDLPHGNTRRSYPEAPCHPGLHVAAGFGARGLVTAPLAAKLLASVLTGDPWPVQRAVAAALHPARFLIRDLRRGR